MQDSETKCDIHAVTSPVDDLALNGSPRRHSSVDEIFGLVNSMNINGQRQRSLSDSSRAERTSNNGEAKSRAFKVIMLEIFGFSVGSDSKQSLNHDSSAPDLVACPPVPPRKHRRRHTPPRPPSNGLPPTPKVHMGACFSKVIFNNTQTFSLIL